MIKSAKRGLWLLILVLIGITSLGAQKGSNPFDLTPKLKEQTKLPSINEDSVISDVAVNPFDIVRKKSVEFPSSSLGEDTLDNKLGLDSEDETAEVVVQKKDKGPFVFWIIVAMLIYLSLLVTLMRPLFVYIFKAFVNDNLLSQLYREQAKGLNLPFLLLYLMFVFNVAVFIYLILDYHGIKLFDSNLKNLFIIFGVFAVVVMLKHSILSFTGWLLPAGKEIMNYNFTIVVFNIVIGIILAPLSILIAYGPAYFVPICIWIGAVAVMLIYLFRFLRGVFLSARVLLFHKFHFLLYLCAVEIAPALVFIKLLLINSGA